MPLQRRREIYVDDYLVVAPAVEVLDLATVKLQRRFTSSALDDRFEAWMVAVRQQFESETGIQCITATRTCVLECFPVQPFIQVRMAPVQQVLEVTYLDSSGDEQPLDPAQYALYPPVVSLNPYPTPGGIQLIPGAAWPTALDQLGSVRIVYQAGYGDDPADVPAIIKDYALLQYLGDMHRFSENQSEQSVTTIPFGTHVVKEIAAHLMMPSRPTRW